MTLCVWGGEAGIYPRFDHWFCGHPGQQSLVLKGIAHTRASEMNEPAQAPNWQFY